TAIGINRCTRTANVAYLNDSVFLNYYIHRANRWRTGAINQRHTTNDKLRVRSFTFSARGRFGHLRNSINRDKKAGKQQRQQFSHSRKLLCNLQLMKIQLWSIGKNHEVYVKIG